MKISLKELKFVIRETIKEAGHHRTPPKTLVYADLDQSIFDFESPDMSSMSPGETNDLVNSMMSQIGMLRDIEGAARNNTRPKPGEIGEEKKMNPKSTGPIYISKNTPEMVEFLKKKRAVEQEFSRRHEERDAAYKREGDAKWNALSPEEQETHRRQEAELDSVYGGRDNRRRGIGLGT